MYPEFLKPISTESFHIDGAQIQIPKCIVKFEKWKGSPVKETFGGKPSISIDNKPMFAELAIMTCFLKAGWQARWVETYGKSTKEPIHLTEWRDEKYKNQIHNPISDRYVLDILSNIAKQNADSYSGCWDVLAWKDDAIIFAESKRASKDNIRTTQIKWLTAGLKQGLNENNFLVVQWNMV